MNSKDNSEALMNSLSQGAIGSEAAKSSLMPPSFEDALEERAYVKDRLAAAFRLFAYFGFDDGLAGHITVRDPLEKDTFWVNPVGVHFGLINASDLVRINHQGHLVEGEALVNTAAFVIHANIHKAHPEVNAVAHAHSKYGRAWSTQGRLLAATTQDSCVFFERHAVFSQFEGVVHGQSEGQAIATKLGTENIALLLQNHGLLTTGIDVDSAVSLFIQLERACENQLLIDNLDSTQVIPAEIARKTREFIGSRLVVWGNFQPWYQLINREQPEYRE